MFAAVTRHLKRGLSVAKSVLAVAGTASATLDPILKSHLREGEQIDGIELLMLTVVRWIRSDHERLEESETEQRQTERQLKKLRLDRKHQQDALYGLLLRIRSTFDDAFGQGLAAVYLGLEPRLRKLEPMTFRRVTQETAGILADPDLVLPEPKVMGLWGNPSQYAEQIRELLKPFQAILDDIETQKREVEKAQKVKAELLEEHGSRLTWSIRLFESIYRLAGLGYHAERLRLTVSSRPNTKAAEASKDGGAASDGEASEVGSEQATDASESTDVASGG